MDKNQSSKFKFTGSKTTPGSEKNPIDVDAKLPGNLTAKTIPKGTESKKSNTNLGISSDSNTVRINNTKDLIANLKKVLDTSDLKLITQQLVQLKEFKKSGVKDISQNLRILKQVMFKD